MTWDARKKHIEVRRRGSMAVLDGPDDAELERMTAPVTTPVVEPAAPVVSTSTAPSTPAPKPTGKK